MRYLGFEQGDDGQGNEEEHRHESSVEFYVVFGGNDPSTCQFLPDALGRAGLLEWRDEERFNKVEWGWAVR